MIAKLTKKNIDGLIRLAKAATVYDEDLKGFGVRLTAHGKVSWFIEYRAGAGGRRVPKKRMVIGGSELTPEQARQAAKEKLAEVALGGDPMADRQRERRAFTFSEFAEQYLAEEAERKLKPGTVRNYKICIRKHAGPDIGRIKLEQVTTADLSRLHNKIGEVRPMTANRVMECISSVFRYAATCNVVPTGHNPTAGIKAYRETRRERFLKSDELARLGEAIREAETVGIPYEIDETNPNAKHAPKPENRRIKFDAYTAAAFRLLIFTGARLREILHLEWEFVDLERGLLLLPDSKTGRKTIVLNDASLAILSSLPRKGRFVIHTDDPDRPRADLNKPWRTLSTRADLVGVRIHDLRHTHASVGAASGMGLPIIGKLLGHTQASTTMRYAHLDANPLRAASDKIGDQLQKAMGENLKRAMGEN